jgi:hypothetical protein
MPLSLVVGGDTIAGQYEHSDGPGRHAASFREWIRLIWQVECQLELVGSSTSSGWHRGTQPEDGNHRRSFSETVSSLRSVSATRARTAGSANSNAGAASHRRKRSARLGEAVHRADDVTRCCHYGWALCRPESRGSYTERSILRQPSKFTASAPRGRSTVKGVPPAERAGLRRPRRRPDPTRPRGFVGDSRASPCGAQRGGETKPNRSSASAPPRSKCFSKVGASRRTAGAGDTTSSPPSPPTCRTPIGRMLSGPPRASSR